MAGAGFKTFATGEVLTAANVNTYLMQQTVMVFDDATARTTALGANVSEGMLSYLKDTNQVEVYNGSSWVASDDPNAIQNTIVDAKGDLITATADNTPARLAVGSNDQVLTADSTTATGLKWAAPAAGGMTSLASGNLSGSNVSLTSISTSYVDLYLVIKDLQFSTGTEILRMRVNGNTTAIYGQADSTVSTALGNSQYNITGTNLKSTAVNGMCVIRINDYSTTTSNKIIESLAINENSTQWTFDRSYGTANTQAAITQIDLFPSGGTFAAGTYILYGVK